MTCKVNRGWKETKSLEEWIVEGDRMNGWHLYCLQNARKHSSLTTRSRWRRLLFMIRFKFIRLNVGCHVFITDSEINHFLKCIPQIKALPICNEKRSIKQNPALFIIRFRYLSSIIYACVCVRVKTPTIVFMYYV